MEYRIRELREAKGITQEALCESAGISRTTLYSLETNGVKQANVATLQKISDALSVTINDLFLPEKSTKVDNNQTATKQ